MKRPPYVYRLIIIALILTVIPITATHYGSVYMGRENGILLGCHQGMKKNELDYICQTFIKFFKHCK